MDLMCMFIYSIYRDLLPQLHTSIFSRFSGEMLLRLSASKYLWIENERSTSQDVIGAYLKLATLSGVNDAVRRFHLLHWQ